MIEFDVFPDMKIRCVEISSEAEMEQIRKIGGVDHTVWYATKDEIEEYRAAQRSLVISADEKCFYNPTNVAVWVKRNHVEYFCVPAGGKIDFTNIE